MAIIDIFRGMTAVASVGCDDTRCTMLAIETLPADGGGQIELVGTLEMTQSHAISGSGTITVTGDLNCYQTFTESGALAPVQAPE